jgi:glycosyltransferase involved in cell wall biosynthesis
MAKYKIVINGRFVIQQLTGVQRYALEVTRRLPGLIQVVAPRPGRSEYEPLSTITIIDPLGRFVQSGVLGHLWEQVALPRWARKARLLWSPCGSGPLQVKNQVLTIHDIAYLEHPEWFNRAFVKWYRFLVPRLVRQVRRVITVSRFTRDRLVETVEVSLEKISVIPNGVDVRFQPKAPEEVARTRNVLGIPSPNYVLSLGSLEPRKNLHRLLKAWSNIHHKLPDDVWLVITGAKGKYSVFQNVSFNKLPPRVYLTGYVPDEYLPALYSGALAFVYVSLYEGFGLPPLEAMACGTPVVTSNITSLPEVVGNAAILVNPYDIRDITDGIYELIRNDALREELKSKGMERAKQFTWDRTAALTWEVLKAVMEE